MSESSLHFVVMALSPLLICKVGAGGLPSFSGSVVRVTTAAAGKFSMVAAEAGLAPGLAAQEEVLVHKQHKVEQPACCCIAPNAVYCQCA